VKAFVNSRMGLYAALLLFGTAWGLTIPLIKFAVSTGYSELGLVFWQLIFSLLSLLCVAVFQGKFPKLTKDHLIVFSGIAFLGTLIPATITYAVVAHIPGGIYAITISLVPMFAMPVAIVIGLEQFQWRRFIGVGLGMLAIVLLVGPSTSLPDPSKAIFVIIACLAPLCYGLEDNFVGKFTLRGLTPVQALVGASLLGAVIVGPLAVVSGQWVSLNHTWGLADWSLLGLGLLHGLAYTGYVWLVGRAGPVFAAQVAYLVTGTGVLWSMLLLGETYAPWIWGALVLMLIGIFMVHPRDEKPQ